MTVFKTRQSITMMLGLLVGSVSCGSALAQEARPETDPGVMDNKLEEIVVTATKRDVPVQDLPMGITALSERQLEESVFRVFQDYAATVPGLSFRGQGTNRNKIAIRGITDGASVLTQPTTGIYLDETPINFTGFDPDIRLVDVSRVEVLRGPQGTLYGAGSVGGTVRVITNKPDFSGFSWKANLGTSFTDNGGQNSEFDGALNVPIIEDKAAIRFVGYYSDEDGFVDDVVSGDKDVNDVETSGGRVSLDANIGDAFSVTATAIFQNVSQGSLARDDLATPALTQQAFVPEFQEDELRMMNLLMKYDFSGATLVSSTTYFEHDVDSILDTTNVIASLGLIAAPPAPALIDDAFTIDNFVQEMRLTSNGDGKLRWLIGGFYSDRTVLVDEANIVPNFDSVSSLPFPIGTDVLLQLNTNTENSQAALFGEISFDLSQNVEVAAGLRWFDYELSTDQTQESLILGDGVSQQSGDETGLTPKISLSYRPTDEALLYAQAAMGFRQGVPNSNIDAFCLDDLEDLGFSTTPFADADSVWNYEVGGKTSWLGNRLIVNAAAYWIDWDDIQVRAKLPCGFNLFVNGAAARSKGAELEFRAILGEALEIRGGVSYTDAKILEGGSALGAADGEKIPNVPRWTASINAAYRFGLSNSLDGFLSGQVQYVGERPNEFSSAPSASRVELDSYSTGNLRAGITNGTRKWQVAIYATNVWDERAEIWGEFGRPHNAVYRNRPRTIGLEVKLNR